MKHRAEPPSRQAGVPGLHWVDHHLTVRYDDFTDLEHAVGFDGTDLWVPSLSAIVRAVVDRLEAFDTSLADSQFRTAIEEPFTIPW